MSFEDKNKPRDQAKSDDKSTKSGGESGLGADRTEGSVRTESTSSTQAGDAFRDEWLAERIKALGQLTKTRPNSSDPSELIFAQAPGDGVPDLPAEKGDGKAVISEQKGDAAAQPKDESLTQFRDYLVSEGVNLGPTQIREALIKQNQEELKALYEGLTADQKKALNDYVTNPEKLRALAELYMAQKVGKLLDEQIKAGSIKPEDADKLREAISKGLLPVELVKSVLKDSKTPPDEAKIAQFEKKWQPETPAVPSEQGKEKTEDIEKPAVAGNDNSLVAQVQDSLYHLTPVLDRAELTNNLRKELRATVEKELKTGSAEDVALKEAFQKGGKNGYEQKLDELADNRIKEMLKKGIDTAIILDKFQPDVRARLEERIDQGAIPDDLLKGLLVSEYKTEGPVTRAIYATAIKSLEQQTGDSFRELVKADLEIPPGFPELMKLDENGRPESLESLKTRFASGEAKVSFGLDPTKLSAEAPSKLRLASRFNLDASEIYTAASQSHEITTLEETALKLGRPEWLKTKENDPQEWLLRVGPLTDMTMEVKAVAQSLSLAHKLAGGSAVNFDESDLSYKFPGKLEFSKDGRITNIELDLPKDISPSVLNDRKVQAVREWLDRNRGPAEKTMAELAKLSVDQGRLLLWQDMPSAGVHEGKDYHLECHRFRIEDRTDSEGKPKVRVYNNVEFYKSGVIDPYNMLSEKVGSKDTKSLDPAIRADLEKKFANNRDSLTTEQRQALETASAQGPEAMDKALDKLAEVDYRDYNPTDMVAIVRDGKVNMVMASELEAFRVGQRNSQNLQTGAMMALDAAFAVSAVFSLGSAWAAWNAAKVGGTLAATALRKIAIETMKREIVHGIKGLAMGGSGLVLNNAYWQTDSYGQKMIAARNIAFAADGIHGGYALAKGGIGTAARAAGWAKPLASISEEAKLVEKVVHGWDPGKAAGLARRVVFKTGEIAELGNKGAMLAGEGYMIWSLSGELKHKAKEFGHHEKSAKISEARKNLHALRESESDGSRLLRRTAVASYGSDKVNSGAFDGMQKRFSEIEKLPEVEKQAEIDKLIKQYRETDSKPDKLVLATGLLSLSVKDGKLKDTIGTQEITIKDEEFGDFTYNDELTSKALFDHISKETESASPDVRLASVQILLNYDKVDMPQYATTCRSVLADANASNELKMKAVIGLGYCADTAANRESSFQTAQERVAAISQSFGCSSKQLQKSLSDLAASSSEADVRAMAVSVLQALNSDGGKNFPKLMAEAQTTWEMLSLDAEQKQLQAQLERTDLTEEERKSLTKQAAVTKAEFDVAWETLAFIKNPQLETRLKDESKKAEEKKTELVLSSLQACKEVNALEKRLQAEGLKAEEKTAIETELGKRKEEQKAIEESLRKANEAPAPSLQPDDMPPIPHSFSTGVNEQLVKALNTPAPEGVEGAERSKWAQKRMEAAHLLGLYGQNLEDADRFALKTALLDMAKTADMDTLTVGVEAVKSLAANYRAELSSEEKTQLFESMQLMLNYDHVPSEYADSQTKAKYRSVATAKEELLKAMPFLATTELLTKENKQALAKDVLAMFDPKKTNLQRAEFPSMRIVGMQALAALDGSSPRVIELLRRHTKIVGELGGEPSAEVRLTAFNALLELKDPYLSKLVTENVLNERDPLLAAKYQAVEFSNLRPNRPESVKRLFAYEVKYWEDVARSSIGKYSDDDIKEFLKTNYPHVDPKTFTDIVTKSEEKLRARDTEITGSTYIFGNRTTDYNAAIAQYRHPYHEGHKADWEKLLKDARDVSGEKGLKARAALEYLATTELTDSWGGRQKDAAQELRKILAEKICPDRERLYRDLTDAWKNHGIPHEVRVQFLWALDDAIKSKPPTISKPLAGRILESMLEEEMGAAKAVGPTSSDWQSVERQKSIIYLMELAEYPLAMAKLEAITKTNPGGAPSKFDPQVREAAQKYLTKLYDTTSRNPGDLNEQAAMLKFAIEEREKFTKGMEAQKANTPINGADAFATHKAIVESCEGQPILAANDPRIPYLQTLLNDKAPNVAMAAAYYLANAANINNTSDYAALRTMQEQPFLAGAIAKLKDIAKLPGDENASIRRDAEDYLKKLDSFGVYSKIMLGKEGAAAKPSAEQQLFNAAKSALDGSRKEVSLSEKKNAVENLVMLSATFQSKNQVELQKQADEILRQVASTQNLELAQVAASAIDRFRSQRKPLADELRSDGTREIKWSEERATRIVSGDGYKIIRYPDNSLVKLNFDEKNQVVSYSSGKFEQYSGDSFQKEKLAGIDFKPGTIELSKAGDLIFDETSGIRRVQRADGGSWSFYRGTPDVKKAGDDLQIVLYNDFSSPEVKAGAIERTSPGTGVNAIAIKEANDIRLPLLNEALGDQSAIVRLAAAKALLEQSNTAVDQTTRQKAKEIFLRESLEDGFLTDKAPIDILKQMREVREAGGLIKDAKDPRLAAFREALNSENVAVRLEAALILSERGNSGVDKASCESAIKTAAEIAAVAYQQNSWELRGQAVRAMRDAGTKLKDFEFTNSTGTTIQLKNGQPAKITYPNGSGSVSFEWNGKELKSFTDPAKNTWTFVSKDNAGNQIWKDTKGASGVFNVYAEQDGSWGWSNSQGYQHYNPEGSHKNHHSGGPYWRHPDGSSAHLDRGGNFSSFYDQSDVNRKVESRKTEKPAGEKLKITTRDSNSWGRSWEKEEEIDATRKGYFDSRNGTHFTFKSGLRSGDTMYGGTISYNRGDNPLSVKQSGATIDFEYKKNTNILQGLKEADGTTWKLGEDNKWRSKKLGADQWEDFDGEVKVNFYGEYTFAKNDGTRIVTRLNGEREEHKPNGVMLARKNGEITGVRRTDGSMDRFTYADVTAPVAVVDNKGEKQPVKFAKQRLLVSVHSKIGETGYAMSREDLRGFGRMQSTGPEWGFWPRERTPKDGVNFVLKVANDGTVISEYGDRTVSIAPDGTRKETDK